MYFKLICRTIQSPLAHTLYFVSVRYGTWDTVHLTILESNIFVLCFMLAGSLIDNMHDAHHAYLAV